MIARRIVRSLPRLLNATVLVVSGAYLLVYLYRWEWNRAVISGVFFIAAEIALATTLLLGELRRRTDVMHGATARTITDLNARRVREPFGWLTRNDRLGVFIPVLLGAGVLLSALAYVVERVAGTFAGPAVDRRTARLVDLDIPLRSQRSGLKPARASRQTGPAHVLAWLLAAAIAILTVVTGINLLAGATQSRLDTQEADTGITTVTLAIEQKNFEHTRTEVAEALWIICRNVAPPGAQLEQVGALADNHVRLVIDPALGELRRRRVFGCLEDATIDRVRVNIVDWSLRG
jgi:hypothetical protein